MDVSIEDNDICFETTGFSVYAIVSAPAPVTPSGINTVTSIDELIFSGDSGFYISSPLGYYFTNGITQINTSRTGITKTAKADSPLSADGAVLYYFEHVEDSSFYVYCMNEQDKAYVKQTANSLSFTTKDSATLFTIDSFPNSTSLFRVLGTDGYYWNMQGGESGKSFAAYANATDPNERIRFQTSYVHMEDDPYDLDGKTFGIAYQIGAISATGLTAETLNSNTIEDQPLSLRPDIISNDNNYLYVAKNSRMTDWTFHCVSEDNYYIMTTIDNVVWYLTISDTGVMLTSTPEENSVIKVRPGTGEAKGKVRLSVGNRKLQLVKGTTGSGFSSSTSESYTWMNLTKRSDVLTNDDFAVYSAKKVSVSDTTNVTNKTKVVIYTRIWNKEELRYDFYLLNHNGTLIQCYEEGDVIEWYSSQDANPLLWEFTEYYHDDGVTPNNYYELRNLYSGKYLAPQIQNGQTLSDNTIGINLSGRMNNDNYSTIVAWDDPYYEYAGIKIEGDRIASCPTAEAQDFYFAILEENETLTTIDAIDNDEFGIKMRMINFNNVLDSNKRDSVQSAFFGGEDNNKDS